MEVTRIIKTILVLYLCDLIIAEFVKPDANEVPKPKKHVKKVLDDHEKKLDTLQEKMKLHAPKNPVKHDGKVPVDHKNEIPEEKRKLHAPKQPVKHHEGKVPVDHAKNEIPKEKLKVHAPKQPVKHAEKVLVNHARNDEKEHIPNEKQKVPVHDDKPVWQKKLKAEEDKVIEGGGDGPIEDASEDDNDIEETEQTEDTRTDEEEEDEEEEEEKEEEEDEDDSDSEEDEEVEKPKEEKKDDFLEKHIELKPPVVKRKVPTLSMINKHTFLEHVRMGNKFIANIGNLGCEKCQKFYEDYRLVLHYFHDTKQKVDAYLITEKQLLDEFNFQKDEYPAILYYRHGIPVLYEGALTATGVQSWVENHSKIAVKELTDDNFHRTVVVTDEKSSQWLVLFYDPQDPKCWRPLALTETLALKQDKLNIGIVDISKNKVLAGKLKDKSNIPSWFLFRKDDMIQLEFLERLTLRHIEETYKEASMTLQEKLGRAAVQVKGFLMYTGGAVTVVLFIFICLCKKVAYVGERRVKKGV
ncbi:uncharacterized protein [Amphiura filiformis]|uniref:uncharacterized protein isoform X2 n=1 Tax=Amphiura filiformis TaxID=82378 RepID=UPI003B222A4C